MMESAKTVIALAKLIKPGIKSLSRHLAKTDPVLLASVVLLAAICLLDPATGRQSLARTAVSFRDILPFLLLSAGVIATARATGIEDHLASIFHGRIPIMILAAALFGALSPFCSCGVIPLITALLVMGVPLAPVMAFWLASPLMDPSMFVLTATLMDTHFAIGRTLAAFGIGLLGGFGTQCLLAIHPINSPLRDGLSKGCRSDPLRDPAVIIWRFWQVPNRLSAFLASARTTTIFLAKWLVLAFVLESLMVAYIPTALVSEFLGHEGPLSVLIAVLLGVPAYLNGFAALPLVASLVNQGMAMNSAMAFLVAGGVTSIPAMMAVFAIARLPVFLVYLAFAFTGSMAAGLLYGAGA